MKNAVNLLLLIFIFCSCSQNIESSTINKPHEGNPNLSTSVISNEITSISSESILVSSIISSSEINEIILNVIINEDNSIFFSWTEYLLWPNVEQQNYILYIENNNIFEKSKSVDIDKLSVNFESVYCQLYGGKNVKVCACEILNDGTINILASSNIVSFPKK